MMSINFEDIAILNIRGVDYRCNVYGISKSKAIIMLKNADLTKRYWSTIKINFFMKYKMGKEIITFGDIKVEKQNFYSHKNPNLIYVVDINKIIVSNNGSFGKNFLSDTKKIMKNYALVCKGSKNECI